jgi:hypothetical protein
MLIQFMMSILTYLGTNYKTFAVSVAAASVGLFMWEHIARVNKVDIYKPSAGINWIAIKGGKIWEHIGYYSAKLSSFLTYIKLDELYQTGQELWIPTWTLIKSPFRFFTGYGEYIKNINFRHPIVIGLGSVTLLVIFGLTGYGTYLYKIGTPARQILGTTMTDMLKLFRINK